MDNSAFRESLEKLSGEPVALSLRVLDFLESTPLDQLKFLTIESFCNGLEIEPTTDLLAALSLMTNSHDPILDRGLLLLDDDGSEHEVDLEEWKKAGQTGYMVHPDTGEKINDYESRLILFYQLISQYNVPAT